MPSSVSEENELKEESRRSKLMALGELESVIEQDVEQSKLNLEAITIQQEQDPLSRNGKTFHLDRIHDLEAVLRDIRTRQLELIEQETKVFDLKHTPNLFPLVTTHLIVIFPRLTMKDLIGKTIALLYRVNIK